MQIIEYLTDMSYGSMQIAQPQTLMTKISNWKWRQAPSPLGYRSVMRGHMVCPSHQFCTSNFAYGVLYIHLVNVSHYIAQWNLSFNETNELNLLKIGLFFLKVLIFILSDIDKLPQKKFVNQRKKSEAN